MKIRILTDSTAIFSNPTFTGYDLVKVVQSDIPTPTDLVLRHPSVRDFVHEYDMLDRHCDHIMVILSSSALIPSVHVAEQAALQHGGRSKVTVLDSLNIGAGLGLLVEMAARAAHDNMPVVAIEQMLRAAIPGVYSLFCIPDLKQLAGSGYLSRSQATVAEIMGLMPVFMLEDGRLSPLEKVRTPRHMLESFQEFLDEFSDPSHVVLVKSKSARLRTRPLRQFMTEFFPDAHFSEYLFSPALTALFGPQVMGLVVMAAS